MAYGFEVKNNNSETVLDDKSPTFQFNQTLDINASIGNVDVIFYAGKFQFQNIGLSYSQAPLAIPGTTAPYVDETNTTYRIPVMEVAVGSTIWMMNNDVGGFYPNDTRNKVGGFAYDFDTFKMHLLVPADATVDTESYGMRVYSSTGRTLWRDDLATARITDGGTVAASTIGKGLGWSITVNSTANCVWCNGAPFLLGLNPAVYSGNQIRMTYAKRLSSTQWKFGRGHIADAISGSPREWLPMPFSYMLAQVD